MVYHQVGYKGQVMVVVMVVGQSHPQSHWNWRKEQVMVVVDYHHPQSHWNWRRRRNQKSQDQDYHFEVTVVVSADPVHSVLLSADYVLPEPVITKLEKGVEFAELQGALDVHTSLLVAALEKAFASITPLFPILVVAPHEFYDDVASVVAMLLAVHYEFYDDVAIVVAMPLAVHYEFYDDVASVVAMPLTIHYQLFGNVAPVVFDASNVVAVVQTVFDSPVLVFVPDLVAPAFDNDAPFLAFAPAPAATAFDHEILAVDALATAAAIVAIPWNALAPVPAQLANISGLLPHVEN